MRTLAKGLCSCGCGGFTAIAKQTKALYGSIKGQPRRYIVGHNRRKSVAPVCGFTVDPVTGCWNWQLSKDKRGYGKTAFEGRSRQAHIVEWIKKNGPVQRGLELDHLCVNPACCNPDHLEPVTPMENKRRSRATKLKREDVSFIKGSKATCKELAAQFKVCASNISQIRRGFSWKDIAA